MKMYGLKFKLLFAVTLLFSCSAKNNNKLLIEANKEPKPNKIVETDQSKLNLLGTIKSISSFAYEVKVVNEEIIQTKSLSKEGKDNCVIHFNEKGNCSKYSFYDIDSILGSEWSYKYDSDGNLVELSEITYFQLELDKKGQPKHENRLEASIIEKNEYNSNGKLIKQTTHPTSGGGCSTINTFEYDNMGRKTSMSEVPCGSGRSLTFYFTYDDNGRLIEEDINPGGKLTYQYNDIGNCIEKAGYYEDGRIMWQSKLKYDDHNNVTEDVLSQSDANTAKRTFKYEYDNNKNWIKRIDFLDDKAIQIVIRNIEYN